MKKSLFSYLLLLSASLIIFSCEKHDHDTEPDEPGKEYKHLRLLVSDEKTNEISLISPLDGKVTSFQSKNPKTTLYVTESGRYATIVSTANNLAETFDSGLENHGDHVDVKGTPKFGLMVCESSKPTHFKGKGNEMLFFNDGDGTLSRGMESDIHTVFKMSPINAGLLTHHGAMAQYSNGNYAVTFKDNSVSGSLPERVVIIDKTGKTLFQSTIATKGIHGNATDGQNAIFGSSSGILVVEASGNQRLIPHPNDFGTAWFGTILETAIENKFIGFTAAKGAYLIDIKANTVSPLLENTDIMQCKTSYDFTKLGLLLHSGDVKIIDLKTGNTVLSQKLLSVTDKASTQKPQMEFSNKFLYITSPITGEIHQIMISDPTKITKIKVSSTPYRLVLLGHESNADH
ncbi:MAG: hypothetical protein IPP61_11570 [Cytophagaceae bacterium]|nr:hypothetical protein [Cytophagaceae bacterium]MBK9933312.1 hypothetical protein [Cytophagaceae bacterium]MBL0302972.1 hypothetical protein [Cytophagaceae bacterium]MBL0325802.1 hypothetical protein [Cytophagaceae bacterium]